LSTKTVKTEILIITAVLITENESSIITFGDSKDSQ
jgi:hypothetical protein